VLTVAVACAVIAVAAGCDSKKTSDRSLSFVDPTDAEQLVGGRRGLLGLGPAGKTAWVDPRSELDFRNGHIPGAIHMPFARVREDHERLLEYDVLIVYGDEYRDPVAEGMSKRLLELGHRDVRTLRGGVLAWSESGRTLETSP
jgi:3-mercaptopyruvate sulfurtransferase SseA